jgi:hypothetical protein
MPLQEDARALDVLRGVDAGALERCNDTAARFRLVLQVLDSLLAPLEFQGFIEVQVALLDALEDAVLLGVLARVDQGRAGEAAGRRNGQNERSKKKVLITILLCVAVADVTTLCRHLTSEHAQDA